MSNSTRNRLEATAGIAVALGAAAIGAVAAKLQEGRSSDDAPGRTARRSFGKHAVTGRTVTIRKPRAELFAFWRDFTNLPAIMENVEKIAIKDAAKGLAVWTIKAPAGRTVEVETTIVREDEGQLIAWRSVEGSQIETEGRVTFENAPGNRGTRVTLIIAYKPPAGDLGRAAAKLFLREPAVQARHDLKRFKAFMETGEITTSARRREGTRAAKQMEAA
ncbi:SRPBCC family protein [Novosphingobium malaysiense]|uniref:Cyclase n=1 Tax=Novosphingobium malaysiense TaxID=1348853 RepID=A0A0B1ZKT5_9SPHN|nr:SRPBCC family protein [Novosphingobium malaysiense]KHK89949.1 cyclase [Novosphingobium malaysiense]